ncbi:hypothetical protein POVWA2_028720 [Plasmodium ovale wallikeri]|uniref:Uncharacterized protein n=1 Tax=Plasmodium ovale wallikeri TaxID=864142 RepID=A0A1A8YW23_PLAOA|nr:hypothetical protein POVWA1_028880 [Plasmodium ovale wallikeri]SBT36146.1 hypothetical protein POVWA2_028720 [Plasmodium ovale wallikeri]
MWYPRHFPCAHKYTSISTCVHIFVRFCIPICIINTISMLVFANDTSILKPPSKGEKTYQKFFKTTLRRSSRLFEHALSKSSWKAVKNILWQSKQECGRNEDGILFSFFSSFLVCHTRYPVFEFRQYSNIQT